VAVELTSTGIAALDTFLKGGLPRGYTTLLLGPSGAGAEIFAKQFAAGGGRRSVYVTTDETDDEVRGAARDAGWDFGKVELVDLQSDFADAMMAEQEKEHEAAPKPETKKRSFDPRDLVEGTSSLDVLRPSAKVRRRMQAEAADEGRDYLGRLLRPFSRLQTPDRMVVHSLDFFLNLYPVEQVVAVLTALKAANARSGGLLLLVLSKGAHGGTVERRLELMADCLIELEVNRKGTTFERFFLVRKVKNRAFGLGVSTYEITPHGFELETLERIV
jgi:KaiC/GvpD/RAD55 family RecA-like ATPase